MRRAPEHVDGDSETSRLMRRRARRSGPAVTERDAGFSLVEIVATIAVMSIIMAPLFSGVIASIRASTYTRNTAQVLTAVENAADRVNRAAPDCNYDPEVQAAVRSIGWDSSQVSVVYSYYVPGATPAVPGAWQTPSTPNKACASADYTPPPLLVQRVKITVRSPDGKVSRTIEVVKSEV